MHRNLRLRIPVTKRILGFCGKCEAVEGDVKCTCDEIFCDPCFQWHIERLPKHQKVSSGQKILRKAWSWVSGTSSALLDMATRSEYFKEDEMAKWFGLYIESSKSRRIVRIIETARYTELAEKSATASANSAKRQFPSIASFVGETRVGKSTLSKLTAHTFTTKFVLMFCGFVLKILSPHPTMESRR